MFQLASKDVEVIQVVRTTLTTRGAGVKGDPMRRVTQYWTLDGELLAENDNWLGPQEQVEDLRRQANALSGTDS